MTLSIKLFQRDEPIKTKKTSFGHGSSGPQVKEVKRVHESSDVTELDRQKRSRGYLVTKHEEG